MLDKTIMIENYSENKNISSKNNIKYLSDIENDKKQRVIYKPKSDNFFQPLVIILAFIGIIIFAVALIFNAYSNQNMLADINHIQWLIIDNSISPNNINQIPINVSYIKISAILMIVSAIIFLICLFIRLVRSFVFISINKEVKIQDIDKKLINQFITKFVFYIAFTLFIVTLALIGCADIAIFNNEAMYIAFTNVYSNYLFISSIFSILTASFFLVYLFLKTILHFINLYNSYKSKAVKDKIYSQSFIKFLINKILILFIVIDLLFLIIALFIYGVNGMQTSLLKASYYVIFYITSGFFCFTFLFSIYTLLINNKVSNLNSSKEEKIRREKARIEKINVKLEKRRKK